MGILVSILYHILNCQGTITLGLVSSKAIPLYHILNCQGTITVFLLPIIGVLLYHILNCQGTITTNGADGHTGNYIIF